MSSTTRTGTRRVRNWVFTLNDYSQEQLKFFRELIADLALSTSKSMSAISYLIFGLECGTVSSRPHLQGYIELCNAMTLSATKKLLNSSTIHLEERKGTQEQAIEYCKKEGNYSEYGVKKEQGKRNDIDAIRQAALDGGLRKVSMECQNYQQVRLAEVFLTYQETPRNFKPKVLWYYGATGLGKSRKARHVIENEFSHSPSDTYTKSDGTKWWPGYDAHKAVIIDDFRDSFWTLTEMLRLLDRYECKVEFKGGYRQFLATTIIVTSAFAPADLYGNTGEAIKQLLRRIDTIEHFVFEWTPPQEQEETIEWLPLPVNPDAETVAWRPLSARSNDTLVTL